MGGLGLAHHSSERNDQAPLMLSESSVHTTRLILVAEICVGQFKNHTRKSKSSITIKVCSYLVPIDFGFTVVNPESGKRSVVKPLLIATSLNATLSAMFISSGNISQCILKLSTLSLLKPNYEN